MSTYLAFVAMLLPTLLVLALATVTVVAGDSYAAPMEEARYARPY